MFLPKRIEYSVRALLILAEVAPQTMKAEALADAHDLPAGYLRALLGELRRADLVHVSRGVGGGYVLARPAADLTLGEIVRRLDGSAADGAPGDIPDGTLDDPSVDRLRELWNGANEARLEFLDTITLADIAGSSPAA